MSDLVARWRRSFRGVILLTVILIVVADWLFYTQPIGWTPGLFGLLIAMAILVRPGTALRSRAGLGLLGAAVLMAAATATHRSPLAIVLLAMSVVMFGIAQRSGRCAEAVMWLRQVAALLLRVPIAAIADSRRVRRFMQRHGRRSIRVATVAALWAVPLIFAALFVMLLAAANPVLAMWLRKVRTETFTLIRDAWMHIGAWRLLLWTATGASVWALLRVRARARRRHFIAAPPVLSTRFWSRDSLFNPRAITRSLVIFNVLFLVQTSMDVHYLFGGGTLPDGMTHAEYAHRGAYPLVATALLAGAFMLLAFRAGAVHPALRTARRLVAVWVAQNVFLTFTAAWRLWLYVDAFSLTRWRIAAAIWMLLVAIGLIWLIVRIAAARTNAWLINANALTASAVLAVCALVPFDELIATFNVTHCREVRGQGEPLDLRYLESLGPDALPAVRWLVGNPRAMTGRTQALATALQRLELAMDERLENWRGWTWRDAAIRDARPAPAAVMAKGRTSEVPRP